MSNFSISTDRLDKIVSQSTHAEEVVKEILFYDWPEGDEHQKWLDSASISEIVEWVDDLAVTEEEEEEEELEID